MGQLGATWGEYKRKNGMDNRNLTIHQTNYPRMNIWSYLEAYPPIKIRLLARTDGGRRAITNAEIAIAGGFTLERVEAISRLTDWESVTLSEMRLF